MSRCTTPGGVACEHGQIVAEHRVAGSDTEVVIVGGGAAGIAAGRRLADARIDCLILEARPRLGGRAWTVGDGSGVAIDLGCGWLHSADRNPWAAVAEVQGRTIDKTPPPWRRRSAPIGFPLAEQNAFLDALQQFEQRLDSLPNENGRASCRAEGAD